MIGIIYHMSLIHAKTGYLEIFLGPMYSGKTSKLLDLYRQYEFCDLEVLVINHNDDHRYTEENKIASHDKVMVPCVSVSELFQVPDSEFIRVQVILIDEAQFFPDLVPWVARAISPEHLKSVYIASLDGDYKRQKFGSVLDLIPICDKVTKLSSICNFCRCRAAIFTFRMTAETEQKVVGNDKYIPLCRSCYRHVNASHE
jgi:thymidine kinase